MTIILSHTSAVQTTYDQLKTNTVLQMKDSGIEFRTI